MDGGIHQDGRGRAGSGRASTWYARSKIGLPPRARQRERSGAALWPMWNTTLHLTVTSRDHLADARNLVIDQVAAVDDACSPYLPDSERPSSDGPLRYTFRPGTNRAVVSVWRSVSVAGFPCTYAKTLSMTAMMRGHAAPGWLRGLGASARLVAANGEVITVGRWPAHEIG